MSKQHVRLQARRQISGLLQQGKSSIREGQGQRALELLKEVCLHASLASCVTFLSSCNQLPQPAVTASKPRLLQLVVAPSVWSILYGLVEDLM